MCHNCLEVGHKKWNCPERRCHQCHKKGHHQKNCPESRKLNRGNSQYSRASENESKAFKSSILQSTIAVYQFIPIPNIPGMYTWQQFQGNLPNTEHLHMRREQGFPEHDGGNYSGNIVFEHPTTLRRPAPRERAPVNPKKDDMPREKMKCGGSESSQNKTVGDSELGNCESAISSKFMENMIIQIQRSDKTASWKVGEEVLVEEGGEWCFGVVVEANPEKDNFGVEIQKRNK